MCKTCLSWCKIKKNQCFVRWQELAKIPYSYYVDNEPDNIKRLCELAKPWINLKASFHIACADIDFLENIDISSFDSWFSKYKNDWCNHWKISDWDSTESFKVIPIGEIDDSDILVSNVKNNNLPLRISL